MRSKSRKGMIKSTIIGIALLIMSFILLFSFTYRFYQKSTEFVNEEACHDALVLVQVLATKIPGQEIVKPWPAQCKTQDKVYYDKDPEKAKRRLAELMSWCWYMMGEGVMKPFDKDWFTSERKCYVCYTVSFPNLESDINPQDFAFYLNDAKAKNGQRYYDYLKFSEDKVITMPLADPVLKSRIYSVVYTTPTNPGFLSFACLIAPAASVARQGYALYEGGLKEALKFGAGPASCAAELIKQFTELRKDDLVYIADMNRDNGGCIGSWQLATKVETGEGG